MLLQRPDLMGWPLPETRELKLNLLVAYPYMPRKMQDMLKANIGHICFLLDSGASTGWKAGKVVQVADDWRFLDGLKFQPWRYFALDVIGNPSETMRNYEVMLKRGCKQVPIFTRGEDFSVLEHYYKTSDVVGLGGLVGTQKNKAFMNGIMKHVGKRRVHWLGFTAIDFLKTYRPYMADSSTWLSGARFGAVKLYQGRGNEFLLSKSDFLTKVPKSTLDVIASYGFDPLAFKLESSWRGGYSLNRTLCAYSIVRKSLDIEKHLGTKLFSASTTTIELNLLLKGLHHESNRRS